MNWENVLVDFEHPTFPQRFPSRTRTSFCRVQPNANSHHQNSKLLCKTVRFRLRVSRWFILEFKLAFPNPQSRDNIVVGSGRLAACLLPPSPQSCRWHAISLMTTAVGAPQDDFPESDLRQGANLRDWSRSLGSRVGPTWLGLSVCSRFPHHLCNFNNSPAGQKPNESTRVPPPQRTILRGAPTGHRLREDSRDGLWRVVFAICNKTHFN